MVKSYQKVKFAAQGFLSLREAGNNMEPKRPVEEKLPDQPQTPEPVGVEIRRLNSEIVKLEDKNKIRAIQLKSSQAKSRFCTIGGWKGGLADILNNIYGYIQKLAESLNESQNKIYLRIKEVEILCNKISTQIDDEEKIAQIEGKYEELRINYKLAYDVAEKLKGDRDALLAILKEIRNTSLLVDLKSAWIAAKTGEDPDAVNKLDDLHDTLVDVLDRNIPDNKK